MKPEEAKELLHLHDSMKATEKRIIETEWWLARAQTIQLNNYLEIRAGDNTSYNRAPTRFVTITAKDIIAILRREQREYEAARVALQLQINRFEAR
jgi:hypothetical protein